MAGARKERLGHFWRRSIDIEINGEKDHTSIDVDFSHKTPNGALQSHKIIDQKLGNLLALIGKRSFLFPFVAGGDVFKIQTDFHDELCNGINGVIGKHILMWLHPLRKHKHIQDEH